MVLQIWWQKVRHQLMLQHSHNLMSLIALAGSRNCCRTQSKSSHNASNKGSAPPEIFLGLDPKSVTPAPSLQLGLLLSPFAKNDSFSGQKRPYLQIFTFFLLFSLLRVKDIHIILMICDIQCVTSLRIYSLAMWKDWKVVTALPDATLWPVFLSVAGS